jgi:hypothetical protein
LLETFDEDHRRQAVVCAKGGGRGLRLSIAWQGWVVLAAFVIGMAVDASYLRGVLRIVGVCLLLAAIGVIAALKTEGGWRWRNGSR